jgi:hypothetical protein
MSQENVERLRAYCESWEMRAMPDLDLLDSEIPIGVADAYANQAYRARFSAAAREGCLAGLRGP